MTRPDRDQKTRLAAYLRAVEGLGLRDIGLRLGGIAEATICSLLKDAREGGLIEEQIVYRGPELSREDDDALHNFTFQSNLRSSIVERMEKAGVACAPRVYLYDLRAAGGSDVPVHLRNRHFADRAAPELMRLLTRPSAKI